MAVVNTELGGLRSLPLLGCSKHSVLVELAGETRLGVVDKESEALRGDDGFVGESGL